VRIAILPDFGGKITELLDKRTGVQWLWTDPTRPIRKAQPGDSYADHDVTGIDECFPNIGVSRYPLDSNIELPDHGELWSKSWSSVYGANWVEHHASGSILNYEFCRRLTLVEDQIFFDYSITNIGIEDLQFFWTLHALFTAESGMEIEVDGNPAMTKEFGFSGRMGTDGEDGYSDHLRPFTWPHTFGGDGSIHDISKIVMRVPLTDKVVLRSPSNGLITLKNSKRNSSIAFKFDPKSIPFVGICYNLGAWPFTGEKAKWVAIEPSLGATDRLDDSAKLGSAPILAGGQKLTFSLALQLSTER